MMAHGQPVQAFSTMQCNYQCCEHLAAYNQITTEVLQTRSENLDLKKELHMMKMASQQQHVIPVVPKVPNYYQLWLETNKENHLLTNKLSSSKHLVLDLLTKFTDFVHSLKKLESNLDFEKTGKPDICEPRHETRNPTENEENETEDNPENATGFSESQVGGQLLEVSLIESATPPAKDPIRPEPEISQSIPPMRYESGPHQNITQPSTSSNSAHVLVSQENTAVSMEKFYHFEAGSKKPYKCNMCDKAFAFPSILKGHIRTHTGEKPFHCDICGKSFSQSTNLSTHVRTHTGEKPFECDVCHKRFGSMYQLEQHYRTHTGERPFQCSTCGKRFRQSTNLLAHARTHTGEKPFECDVCQKRFASVHHLEQHYRTHTGEKPYECKICGKMFRQSSHLSKHELTHKYGKSHTCKTCHRSFRLASSLATHSCILSQKIYCSGLANIRNPMRVPNNSENKKTPTVRPDDDVIVLEEGNPPKQDCARAKMLLSDPINIAMLNGMPHPEYYHMPQSQGIRNRETEPMYRNTETLPLKNPVNPFLLSGGSPSTSGRNMVKMESESHQREQHKNSSLQEQKLQQHQQPERCQTADLIVPNPLPSGYTTERNAHSENSPVTRCTMPDDQVITIDHTRGDKEYYSPMPMKLEHTQMYSQAHKVMSDDSGTPSRWVETCSRPMCDSPCESTSRDSHHISEEEDQAKKHNRPRWRMKDSF